MTPAKALEIWTAQSLCDAGVLLSIFSFLLHLGRPYFDRILARMTLRVAADLWWLAYIAMRDASLLLAVFLGFFCLNLDLMADIKIGLPFCPLATVALSLALVVKVFWNTEDLGKPLLFSTVLAGAGALLNTVGFSIIMEAPGDEYAVVKTAFWQAMRACRSNLNPTLSTYTFYIAFAMLGGILVLAVILAALSFCKAAKDGDSGV